MQRARHLKSPLVNVTVHTVTDGSDKENKEKEKAPKSKKSSRADPATLPGNVNKAANIQLLQEHWKCPQKTPVCSGTHCFVTVEGAHMALSHQRLDCWASAMVGSQAS